MRIAIVDDHPIFRAGLRKLLESERGVHVVGEGSNGHDALPLVTQLRPDVLLLDFSMPGAGGLAALRALAAGPPVMTVLLTAEISREDAAEALRLGAVGVILKSVATELLFRCLNVVLNGEYWIDRGAAADLRNALRALEGFEETPGDPPVRLSLTERRILVALKRGASNKGIARELGLAEQTVKNHLSNLYERFSAKSRLDLVLKIGRERSDPD